MSSTQPPMPPPISTQSEAPHKPLSVTITLPSGLEARNSIVRGFLQIPAQLGIMFSVFLPAYSYGAYGLDSSTSFWELAQTAERPILSAPFWIALALVGIVFMRLRAEVLEIRQTRATVRFLQASQLMGASFIAAHSLVFWGTLSGTTNPMNSGINIGVGVYMAGFFSLLNAGLVLWDFMGDTQTPNSI